MTGHRLTGLNGSPASCGVPPGIAITIEYVRMAGDLLAAFSPIDGVMRLNVDADWAELLDAYRREIRRAFGDDDTRCAVVPLPARWKREA